MAKPNVINITNKTKLGPLYYDEKGRPFYAIFGTEGDDIIKFNRAQEYDKDGKPILLSAFGLGGNDILFQVPGLNQADNHWYGNTGGGGRGTSFPNGATGQKKGEYDQIHIGAGGLSNTFDPKNHGQTDTFIHGSPGKKPASVHRFDHNMDRLFAEGPDGWQLDSFRFRSESKGGGEHWAEIESMRLTMRDYDNPITNGQKISLKFNKGAYPNIQLDNDNNYREEVRDWIKDQIEDGTFIF